MQLISKRIITSLSIALGSVLAVFGADEIIIDNSSAAVIGTWISSTSTSGYYGANYLQDNNDGKGSKSVVYTPNIYAAGRYAVYVRWTAGTNRASNTPVIVQHANGSSTVLVNQKANGGTWNCLGAYTFNAGTGGKIVISNANTDGTVIADAVRLVPNIAYFEPSVVTVDSVNGANLGGKAIDGNVSSDSSRWVSASTAYPHWIAVDFGANFKVETVAFYTGYGGSYSNPIKDYTIEGWDEAASKWVPILCRTGNDNSVVIENFPVTGTRKIRLYGQRGGDNYLRLYELEVFGVSGTTPATTPDLSGYHLTFNDEFTGPLDISNSGTTTKWTAHTPYNGDFGDAYFTNPAYSTSPFSTSNGVLRIMAWKDPATNNHWRSGLLSSVAPGGVGFSQQYGYFEARMQFPGGLGTWPSFWMATTGNVSNPKTNSAEVDVVEQYGAMPNSLYSSLHTWAPSGTRLSTISNGYVAVGMAKSFHTYGVKITPATIYYYFDGNQIWSRPTPTEANDPFYLMLDLAIGGGWPIDQAPSPSYLYVDYVRAYAN